MITSKAQGFTLIEILIASTLLSVMMLILTGSLRISVASWDSGEKKLSQASRMFVVADFLRNHIGSLFPVASSVQNGQLQIAVKGTQETLSYIASLPYQIDTGGLYKFLIYKDIREGQKNLRIKITPFIANANQTPGTEDQVIDDLVILDDIEEFELNYFKKIPSTGMGTPSANSAKQDISEWTTEWTDVSIPTLIRLKIKPKAEDAWPAIVISPKIQITP